MDNVEQKNQTFGWMDTPWVVATLLGAWGVMIGIEAFTFANTFMVIAGLAFVFRLYKDTIQHPPRRKSVFILGVLIAVVIICADVYFSKLKRQSLETKAQEIPGLKSQISALQTKLGDLRTQLGMQDSERKVDEGKSEQKLDDIKQENGDLRKSVETKDAALVSIAKDQYALNFFPQIAISSNGSIDTMAVQNNGKTNIESYRLVLFGVDVPDASVHQTIAPSSYSTYTLSSDGKKHVMEQAGLTGGESSFVGTLYLMTLDHRLYTMGFKWTFEVSQGNITKSFITNYAIVPESESKPE